MNDTNVIDEHHEERISISIEREHEIESRNNTEQSVTRNECEHNFREEMIYKQKDKKPIII